jgi:hypothetical protein
MSERVVVASFDSEEALLRAARLVRDRGFRIVDAYTPYAVHGLDSAMGLRRCRLPAVCFLCGLAGVVLGVWFQFWTNDFNWPVNVGGRPWNSLPAFVPVTFEMMVLFASLGLVLAWLLVSRLYPGKVESPTLPQVNDDRFALIVAQPEATPDYSIIRKALEEGHALGIEEHQEREW